MKTENNVSGAAWLPKATILKETELNYS